MLGLRRAEGCQVDLHQGDPARFVSDLVIERVERLPDAARAGIRHVVLVPAAAEDPGRALEAVRSFVFARELRGRVARITVMLDTAERYDAFQAALFDAFPEAL
jgi:hypothetical protein